MNRKWATEQSWSDSQSVFCLCSWYPHWLWTIGTLSHWTEGGQHTTVSEHWAASCGKIHILQWIAGIFTGLKYWASATCVSSLFILVFISGPGLVKVTSISETSTLKVEAADKMSSRLMETLLPRPGYSDAGKVHSQGSGLSQALVGLRSRFSVDCSKAGESWIDF